MKQRKDFCSYLVLSIITVVFLAGPAKAEIKDCGNWISTWPDTITVPGVYCVGKNNETNNPNDIMIKIDSDDVILDLNGYLIDGSPAGAGTNAIGIYTSGHENITIKNGTIKGFKYGIQVSSSAPTKGLGIIIENVKVLDSTRMGIVLNGDGNIVRNSQVLNTGIANANSNASLIGIYGVGRGNIFVHNHIYEMGVIGVSYGMYLSLNFNGLVDNNFISNSANAGNNSYGIYIAGQPLVKNNSITNMKYGIYFSGTAASSKYRDNLTNGVTTPYGGIAIDAGNNN